MHEYVLYLGVQIAAADDSTHFTWLKAFSELGADILPLPEVRMLDMYNVH